MISRLFYLNLYIDSSWNEMKKLLFCIIIILLSVGCKRIDQYSQLMDQADCIMESNQDSALFSIRILDGIRPHISEMPEAERMRFNLLYSKAMNKSYINFTSDSTMKEVTSYYDRHGTNYDKLMAHYLLGCVYRDLGDTPTAINCYYDAETYAGKNKMFYLMLNRVHSQIADLLDKQALAVMAIKEYQIASHFAMMAGEKIDAIANYNLESHLYLFLNKENTAVLINDSAIQMYNKLGFKQYAAQINGECFDYYIRHKEYFALKKRLYRYEQYSGYFHNGEIEEGREVYYYYKGLYYLGINRMDSAQILFRKCLNYIADPNMKVAAYHGLSLLYQKMEVPDSTAKYAMMAYNANDSAYQQNAATTLLQMQSLYNYSRHADIARKNAESAASLQRWLFASVLLLACCVGISAYIYKRNKRLNKKQMALQRKHYEAEKALLEKEKNDLRNLLEKKVSLLENINGKLVQSMEELNMGIRQKEISIKSLQEKVEKFEHEVNIKDYAALEAHIQKSAIKKEFCYYVNHVNKHPSEAQWKRLSKFANTELPQLFLILNHYHATEREFRICILTRLKFKPGEVVNIMDCNFSDVTLIRSRLLKKIFNIDDGKPADFDRRIMLMY